MIEEVGRLIIKLTVRSKHATEAALYAIATVSEHLLNALHLGCVETVESLGGQLQRRIEAKTKVDEAEAAKKMAEAVKAANEAIAQRLELESRTRDLPRVASTESTGTAMRKDVESLTQAEENLMAALRRYSEEGGSLFIVESSLRKISEQNGLKTDR